MRNLYFLLGFASLFILTCKSKTMKSIKIILLFALMQVALPKSYCITIPKLEQDSVKQKHKISNAQMFNAFELIQGIVSFVAGIAVIYLGSIFLKINAAPVLFLGKLFVFLGVLGLILGSLLLIHFFVRRSKKRQGINTPK